MEGRVEGRVEGRRLPVVGWVGCWLPVGRWGEGRGGARGITTRQSQRVVNTYRLDPFSSGQDCTENQQGHGHRNVVLTLYL